MISSNFVAYYGHKNYGNFDTQYWAYGIWGHYSNVPTEEMCAFRCFVDTVEHCSYYFWGHGHCQLGHYNHAGHNIYGSYSTATKYMVRNDFSKYKFE